jgi:hypothetical protein
VALAVVYTYAIISAPPYLQLRTFLEEKQTGEKKRKKRNGNVVQNKLTFTPPISVMYRA